jgi:hypothetical protein
VIIQSDQERTLERWWKPMTSIGQERDPGVLEYGADGSGASPVIVVPQDREGAERSDKGAEGFPQSGRMAGGEGHEVAAEEYEIGLSSPESVAGCHNGRRRGERASMEVRGERDAQPVGGA